MKKILFVFLCALFAVQCFSQKTTNEHYLVVGTYTKGKSKGINVFKFNSQDGSVSFVSETPTSNPSYLTFSPGQKFIYAVNENNNQQNTGGGVTAFSFDKKTGTLSQLNEQPSGGDDPCYITVDKTNKWVIVGNYSSGTFSIFPIQKDGSLGAATTHIQHEGSSVNSERQEGPHVHETVLTKDNKYLFVPDLGMDKVMIYDFNSKNGTVAASKTPYVEEEAGTGPRHIAFSPDGKYAYVITEMGGNISAYAYEGKGQLALLQNISALPPDYTGPVGSAEIEVSADGRFLYASNRGESNTIAVFSINPKDGQLTLLQHQSTLGSGPRHFTIDPSGNFLLVGNQNSDSIVIFKRDKKTGLLTDSGKRIAVGSPVCLQWATLK
ncbi:MAG TPA: lactonase family protein [Chitinophagaceae bacterium]|jgi:6-phosphogluconolactonase|nr:lactonase family protein [Chitinophagaceae bacterium]